MKVKKPFLEYVQTPQDSSLRLHHNQNAPLCLTKSWHYHPEIEFVCIPEGKGRLYIGNQTFSYENGVLILLNSNIPHTSFDYGYEGEKYEEYVIQVAPTQIELLVRQFTEFAPIKTLLDIAQEGIVLPLKPEDIFFKTRCSALPQATALKKWLIFMEILDELSQADYTILGVASGNNLHPIQAERIQKVFDFIAQNLQKSVSSRAVADLLNLTDTSFCRFFQKHTQKTFKQVLNEYRINHACKLLAFSDKSIEQIAYESGYVNQPFFNRVFKEMQKTSPLAYRRNRQQVK
ncbi:MAG: AraC family transcriptional regulator [Microscillaceae bacterium]|jgi:AraC-like DNA-binding protein|nr:AraC family transcriptional regulator [Microscillaceae bacterium]